MANPVEVKERPAKRARLPSTRLTDSLNDADLELTSHRKARSNANSRQTATSTSTTTASKRKHNPAHTTAAAAASSSASSAVLVTLAETSQTTNSLPQDNQLDNQPSRAAIPPATSSESDSDKKGNTTLTLKERSRDIDQFFEPAAGEDRKRQRRCIICKRKGATKDIVSEVTTLRRHIEAMHENAYNKWAAKENFKSKLPKAVRAEKDARIAKDRAKQQPIDPYLSHEPPKEKIVPYTDALFRDAAVQWLIETNQPIQALEHPSFKNMIDIAARSTRGVVVPNRKGTRAQIIKLFKQNLSNLRDRLMKRLKTGLVSLTCDAWQASNANAYFAVTGHWNEEVSPNNWEHQSALFGFTQMNTAHNGVHLGRALYKIVRRVGVEKKVGWVTCDNASNNMTMLEEFAKRLNASDTREGLKPWDSKTNHIRCLAHVINLATQAFIAGYSKTKYFDPEKPDDHNPDIEAPDRDVVGLVRAITVKVCSSAKRKQWFKTLQGGPMAHQKVLLLDMKVRWSSTLVMMQRGFDLRAVVDEFVYELGREETDRRTREKIDGLKLTKEEWSRAEVFIDLLKHADRSQHAFSYEGAPCLHKGIPALESLHRAWNSRVSRPKYAPFAEALKAGASKIEEYYEKTATSHAYTFVMLLHPDVKMNYFCKHWDEDLQAAVLRSAEEIFKERYYEMYRRDSSMSNKGKRKQTSLYDDEVSSDDDTSPISPVDGPEPWRREFNRFLQGEDELSDGMTLVQFWGLNSSRLPVWASLAFDYLAIMASSVSSERAFSAAGITISKRRNRLKGDIVEAIEFLKSFYAQDLLYREPALTASREDEMEIIDDDNDSAWIDEDEPVAWDSYVIDLDSDDDN